jgi:hypothetical protein
MPRIPRIVELRCACGTKLTFEHRGEDGGAAPGLIEAMRGGWDLNVVTGPALSIDLIPGVCPSCVDAAREKGSR